MSWCRPSPGCLSTVVQIVTHVACLITFSTCVALAVYFAPVEVTSVARICVGGEAPGRRHPALHQSCTSVKLSRAAGDLWALHHSAESWVEPQNEIKMAQNYRWNDIWGRVFVNVVSVKYIGMIYINVGEMWFIPMNVYNELFNGVRQLRWQHLSPVVSTFSTSSRLLSFFFLKHCILPPSSLSVPSICLSFYIPFS